jgi:hypothetical protein
LLRFLLGARSGDPDSPKIAGAEAGTVAILVAAKANSSVPSFGCTCTPVPSSAATMRVKTQFE